MSSFSFEEKPKKYKLVSLENRVSRTDETKIPIEMTSKLESKLVPTVRELIKEMVGGLVFGMLVGGCLLGCGLRVCGLLDWLLMG